jgi:hypothetical protein
MRKSIVIFLAIGMAATAGLLSADQITVLAPASGTYKVATNLDIVWTYQFMEWLPSTAAQRRMVITLYEYNKQIQGPVKGGRFTELATVDVNAGRFTWKVDNIDTKWDGFIFVLSMKENPAITAQSQPFQVEKIKIPMIPIKAAANLAIPVTSPVAGQNCKIGSTLTIRWDKSRIAGYGYIWIQVCWPNHTGAGGAYPTSNTGSYDWKIAETAENTFCIKVSTQDDKWVGYSGNFNVKK